MSTIEQDASPFRTWWRKRSFYAKNFIVLDLIGLFVIMVALVASAASSNASSSDTYSPSSYASQSYSEADYLAQVRASVTGDLSYSDADMVNYGYGACNAADDGLADEWMHNMVYYGTTNYSGAWQIMRAAQDNLC